MKVLRKCPACDSQELRDVDLETNLTSQHKALIGQAVMWEASYASCPQCELMFARNRQEQGEIDAYYAAFAAIEKRKYTVYPLPEEFIELQSAFSERLIGKLRDAQLISPDISVLNIRCECGIHLEKLRDEYDIKDVYGLDYFESNLRHAREKLGLNNVGMLEPYLDELPFGQKKFDLILANHLLTHALDPMGLLRLLRDRLSPGGAIVFYNELDHIPIMDMKKVFSRGIVSYHKQLLTRASLENMLRSAGYDTEWLDYDPVGIKWASGCHSLSIIGRPNNAGTTSTAINDAQDGLYNAYLEGRRKYSLQRLLAKAKKCGNKFLN
ncbi:MAG: class I SAM-dependent methyltransferase [Geminicoccaceae bacterium]